ncbi:hypothetical protein Dcar01_00662 [Deinococcus carri]|uniref:DUF1345 domain-containing protein n=1 Tax=Deinococcus carri TaxID=1211323 RepID=A0ABP9W3K9_9DEIO
MQVNPWGQYERSALWSAALWAAYISLHALPPVLRIMTALNVANGLYLLLTWWAVQRSTAPVLRQWATRPFPRLLEARPWLDFWLLGGRTGLSFVLSASLLGFLVAAGFLPARANFELSAVQEAWLVGLCLLAVATAWLMAHLAYALHYAFLYYRQPGRPLTFPQDDVPDLMDFAYFAFTVGTTFASSDVEVTSKLVRRTVLGHMLFAFVFNTAILALTLQFSTG